MSKNKELGYAERLQRFGYNANDGYQIANDMLNVVANLVLLTDNPSVTGLDKELSLSVFRTIAHAKNMLPTTAEFLELTENSAHHTQKLSTKGLELVLPSCLTCGADFLPNHHKQKYCCMNCKTKFWEQKTGKRLPYKRSNQ